MIRHCSWPSLHLGNSGGCADPVGYIDDPAILWQFEVAGEYGLWGCGKESQLKAAGVEHLFLHGSYARGTAVREVSDVDVLAEFSPARRLYLLGMVAIENRLADMLGARVDLSPAKGIKEPVAAKASREAVRAS